MKMHDDEKPRSIRFPERLWNAIDIEAKRCKRSSVKQMEAVLSAYYGLADVELNNVALERAKGSQDFTRTREIEIDNIGVTTDRDKNATKIKIPA